MGVGTDSSHIAIMGAYIVSSVRETVFQNEGLGITTLNQQNYTYVTNTWYDVELTYVNGLWTFKFADTIITQTFVTSFDWVAAVNETNTEIKEIMLISL